MSVNSGLISHQASQSLAETVALITERVQHEGDKPNGSVAYQLDLLAQLQQFDFGKFLLLNQGINGYWTHYMLTHPSNGRVTGKNNQGAAFTALEKFILDEAPTMLATQERFTIFLEENQKAVKDGTTLTCLPCGMMAELSYLNFQGVTNCQLVGIDYDDGALIAARKLSEQRQVINFSHFFHANAWELTTKNEYDLISSNGLTIYEPDDKRVGELYQLFHQALKPGGRLVTSYLTPPPTMTKDCEWNMAVINMKHLALQQLLFSDIIGAKFRCFRSSAITMSLLEQAGFDEFDIHYDKARLFPTIIAYKK